MVSKKKVRRVREQVVVYLDARDRALLEQMAEDTGLSRTELLRRGLWRLASDTLVESKPGRSLDRLIGALEGADLPTDLSTRHDEYLYGRVSERRRSPKRKRARPR